MQLPSPRLFKEHFVHFLLRSDEKFVWQASTPWNQFTLDETLGTNEGRRNFYEGKVLENWMRVREDEAGRMSSPALPPFCPPTARAARAR